MTQDRHDEKARDVVFDAPLNCCGHCGGTNDLHEIAKSVATALRAEARAGEPEALRSLLERTIDEWQTYWMSQKDGGYFGRALGVDANMRHGLVRMLSEALAAPSAEGESNGS